MKKIILLLIAVFVTILNAESTEPTAGQHAVRTVKHSLYAAAAGIGTLSMLHVAQAHHSIKSLSYYDKISLYCEIQQQFGKQSADIFWEMAYKRDLHTGFGLMALILGGFTLYNCYKAADNFFGIFDSAVSGSRDS